ncbi:MAG: penicillin-binding transpeptidase domain-containing protein, partial [Gaiellaceae bacterium]
MALRLGIFGVLAIIIFCALFFRLWALQVISGDQYLSDAQNNQIRSFRLQAQRGPIVDRDGDVLVTNMPGTLVQVWPAALEDVSYRRREAMLLRLSRVLGLRPKVVKAKVAKQLANDPLTPVTVSSDVGDRRAAFLLEHQTEFPGVQITETYLRRYEKGTIAAQILGYESEITAEQLAKRTGGTLAAGDRIGQTGIEAAYDSYLRGQPGLGRVYVDALGRVTSERQFSQMPESGDSLRLTIDDELQRTAEDALDFGVRLAHDNGEWAANGGALVAMDVRTGEILALASNPTFDPSVYVGTVDEKDLKALANKSANFPTLNRAIDGTYPPGSTFKPITALAALEQDLLSPGEVIQCTGKMVVDKQTFMNWDPYRNEPMVLSTALANSCDTYFYDVGLRFYRLENSPLQRWSRQMGFGVPTGVDLGPESKGVVP